MVSAVSLKLNSKTLFVKPWSEPLLKLPCRLNSKPKLWLSSLCGASVRCQRLRFSWRRLKITRAAEPELGAGHFAWSRSSY